MRAYERFLNYVPVWTTSDETSDTVPSADRELVLARMLVEEMKGLGIADARVDDKGYVYGHIPATPGCEDKPSLGLVAHMDTVADASGENIKPQIIENYDGKDVVLKGSGDILKVDEFPYLAELKGRTLITTDGTTLLGACLLYTSRKPAKRLEMRHGAKGNDQSERKGTCLLYTSRCV